MVFSNIPKYEYLPYKPLWTYLYNLNVTVLILEFRNGEYTLCYQIYTCRFKCGSSIKKKCTVRVARSG